MKNPLPAFASVAGLENRYTPDYTIIPPPVWWCQYPWWPCTSLINIALRLYLTARGLVKHVSQD